MNKKAILLINVGTPDSPEVRDVRKYLSQFLKDKRVITLPFVIRKILVDGIIVPFRSRKSSKLYRKLWTENGSPLLSYSRSLASKLNKELDENPKVFFGMRYGNPSVKSAMKEIKDYSPDELMVLPLYPQYASSTTESSFDVIKRELASFKNEPEIKFVKQFYNCPEFIQVFYSQITKFKPFEYEHLVFSYHGLPLSHLNEIHSYIDATNCNCEYQMPTHGKFCYKAACYETTRLLAKELGIQKENYSVAFQSRLSRNWISPFTDEVIKDLAKKGVNKLLVIAPSFVTDCLETIIEIEDEYRTLFIKQGGLQLDLVHSLNDSDAWIKALAAIISNQ